MKKTGEKTKLQNQIKIQYSKAPHFQAAKIEHKIKKMDLFKNVYMSNIWKGSDPDPRCAKNRKRIYCEAVGAFISVNKTSVLFILYYLNPLPIPYSSI